MRQVGAALSTVTCLHIKAFSTSSSAAAAADLTCAMQLLVSACPALTSYHHHKHIPLAILNTLSIACPKLSEVAISSAGQHDPPHNDCLQEMLLFVQPAMFPNLSRLSLPNTGDDFQLPDMSHWNTILRLELPGLTVTNDHQWRCLPRNLKQLTLASFDVGPSASADGGPPLSCLTSLTMDAYERPIELHALAQFLRVAPKLEELTLLRSTDELEIQCTLHESAAAVDSADLSLLQQMARVHNALKNATFCFTLGTRVAEGRPWQNLVAALPCLDWVTGCELVGLVPGELATLLGLIPGVNHLKLVNMSGLDNVELQDVAACTQLGILHLAACICVSPMGLLSLCHSRSTLRYISFRMCPKMTEIKLQECELLLRKRGFPVEFYDWD